MKKPTKSKYLIYNEDTKLIEIKPDSKSSFQLWLERYKIYFETVMMLFVSVAGVIVSSVGIYVAIVANDISKEANRREDLEKQPAFIYDTEKDGESIKHLIKNVGGDIKYGNVFVDEVLVVTIHNENYEYLGKGYVFLAGYFEKDFDNYDFETECFEVYSTLESKPVIECIEIIQSLIIEEGFFCGIECTEYFDFTYRDYKLETVQKDAILQAGIICDIEDNANYEFKMRVDLHNLDSEELSEDLKKELALLVKYNSY